MKHETKDWDIATEMGSKSAQKPFKGTKGDLENSEECELCSLDLKVTVVTTEPTRKRCFSWEQFYETWMCHLVFPWQISLSFHCTGLSKVSI